MAVSVLNSTASPCISFSAIGQVSATNPPQTQSCKTLNLFPRSSSSVDMQKPSADKIVHKVVFKCAFS